MPTLCKVVFKDKCTNFTNIASGYPLPFGIIPFCYRNKSCDSSTQSPSLVLQPILFTYFYFIFLTEWHAESWFHDQGLNLCPLRWKHGFLTTGLPGRSPPANLKLKLKSFMMAWRAPQGLTRVSSVTSFATTIITYSCCHPGFLAVLKICQMCSCLRAFALAVFYSLT